MRQEWDESFLPPITDLKHSLLIRLAPSFYHIRQNAIEFLGEIQASPTSPGFSDTFTSAQSKRIPSTALRIELQSTDSIILSLSPLGKSHPIMHRLIRTQVLILNYRTTGPLMYPCQHQRDEHVNPQHGTTRIYEQIFHETKRSKLINLSFFGWHFLIYHNFINNKTMKLIHQIQLICLVQKVPVFLTG